MWRSLTTSDREASLTPCSVCSVLLMCKKIQHVFYPSFLSANLYCICCMYMNIYYLFFFFFCSFLAKRGVKEDIATFEARNISTEIRQSVEELLHRNKTSFDPKVRSSHWFLHCFSATLSCSNVFPLVHDAGLWVEREASKCSSCSSSCLGQSQRPVLPCPWEDRATGEGAGWADGVWTHQRTTTH